MTVTNLRLIPEYKRQLEFLGSDIANEIISYTVYDEQEHTIRKMCRQGNLEVLRYLMQADYSAVCEYDLMVAVAGGSTQVISFLLNYMDLTPLMIARAIDVMRSSSNFEGLRVLPLSQIHLDRALCGILRSLTVRKIPRYIDIITHVLERGARIQERFELIASLQSVDIVRIFHSYGADYTDPIFISTAIANCDIDLVRYLADLQVDTIAIQEAVVNVTDIKYRDIFIFLIQKLHDAGDLSPRLMQLVFCLACSKKNLRIIVYLHHLGADLNYQDYLFYAAHSRNWSIVKYLLAKGANVSEEATIQIIIKGSLKLLKFARFRGAQFNSIILLVAIEYASLERAKYIFKEIYPNASEGDRLEVFAGRAI